MIDNIQAELAGIKTSQEHLVKQMDSVVKLLERMVKVEESQKATRDRLVASTKRIDKLETLTEKHKIELGKWQVYRQMGVWVSGVFGAIISGLIVWYFKDK